MSNVCARVVALH